MKVGVAIPAHNERYATEDECVQRGGHCWTDQPQPLGADLVQGCRHCPATRSFTRDGRRWNVTQPE